MGLAFKENCPDIRNTRVIDLFKEFESFYCNVDVYDPWVNKKEAYSEYGIKLIQKPVKSKYDADLLIYFTDSKYDAKWNKTSKKQLMY